MTVVSDVGRIGDRLDARFALQHSVAGDGDAFQFDRDDERNDHESDAGSCGIDCDAGLDGCECSGVFECSDVAGCSDSNDCT